jgi:hypothetical protein
MRKKKKERATRPMIHGRNIWVVFNGRRYGVKQEGSHNASFWTRTQDAAIAIARLMAHENHSELIIQGRHGRIREKDSHGFDAFPPRG